MRQADEMFDFLLELAKVSPAISKSEGHVRFGVDGTGEFQRVASSSSRAPA